MEKLIEVFIKQGHLIFAVILAIIVYSAIQAVVTVLRDMFLVKFFKKKINGDAKNGNGGMTREQGDELIKQMKSNGATQTAMKTAIEGVGGKVTEVHDIVCETDKDKFPKIRVMEKKVREIWDRVVRKVDTGG